MVCYNRLFLQIVSVDGSGNNVVRIWGRQVISVKIYIQMNKGEYNMPSLDDFHAFKSTGGDSGGSGNPGCSGGFFVWILVILAVLWIIGKLS